MNDMIIRDALRDSGFFSPLDFQFAGFIAKLEGVDDPFLRSISALLSRSARRRDVCLNLESLPDDFPEELSEEDRIIYPSPDEIVARLRTYAIVGAPGERKPVILDGTRLYLLKFFRYETLIASEVAARAADIAGYEGDDLRTMLDELFPAENDEVDWQRCAAINASTRRLSVITGGPGSGKTTTVVKVLLILMNDHQRRAGSYPDIALAAPTGKAAAHMQQSVASAVDRI
ncbi:MAG TPA: AAA family ATPase, partial [Spirochaetota bacterium]|nr:AAA family ATPase [Spirochaetota bacterium]